MTHPDGAKVPCPACTSQDSRTLATRYVDGKIATWRRRLCLECGARFSTLETVIAEDGILASRTSAGIFNSTSAK